MKKLIWLIMVILPLAVLSGCKQYTSENRYICENGKLTDEQARIMVDNGKYTYPRRAGDPAGSTTSGMLCVRVKKVSSTHYYWEENGKKVFYTDTTLQILEILLSRTEMGDETYSVGDEVRILEYYSYKPNGDFISAEGIVSSGTATDGASFSLTVPIPGLDGHENVLLSPFVKADTEYILLLHKYDRIENEDQRFFFGGVQIPYEKVKGMFF